MLLRVLGSAASGGLPQWNCGGASSVRARAGDRAVPPRAQDSLAVSAGDGRWNSSKRSRFRCLSLLRGMRGRTLYTHLDGSNPALDASSAEAAQLRAAGVEIASDGIELALPAVS